MIGMATRARRGAHQAVMIQHAAHSLEVARMRGNRIAAFSCCRCHADFEERCVGRIRYCPACRAEMHYVRMDATREVQHAVRLGRLLRADQCRCVDCDGWAEVWDHRDYSKPLQVEPVCQSCNMRRGAANFLELPARGAE